MESRPRVVSEGTGPALPLLDNGGTRGRRCITSALGLMFGNRTGSAVRRLSGGTMPDQIRERLAQALRKIDRPGTFCVSGSQSAVLPGLEVNDLGPVGLPLSASQAEELKRRCEQAPYGQGERTLVDTDVRRVWRLTPDRFSLNNLEWKKFLATIVKRISEELGLGKRKLETNLHELLLYEKGCFFLPHRDGEKLAGMVATLVVVLPSAYEGGELVVRHDGGELTIDFSRVENSAFQTHFAAFYADCEHEVRPLTSGYRLCLVYNLTLSRAKKALSAPRQSEHVAGIEPLVREWAGDESARKLVVMLDHQYTKDGLTWDRLKGADAMKAGVLALAARQAGCRAYLALLTLWESGEAEGGYGYGRRYGRGYGRSRWEDEDNIGGRHKMGEVFETSLTAENLSDLDGEPPPVPILHVEQSELLEPEILKAVTPEEHFEGYTGNAGMTLDRWYRHAAVILWPERGHFEVLCEDDGRRLVPLLQKMVAEWSEAGSKGRPELKAQCVGLARAVLASWPRRPSRWGESREVQGLLDTVAALGEPDLVGRFLGQVLAKDASADPGTSFVKTCQEYGWKIAREPLRALFRDAGAESMERNVRLLERVCLADTPEDAAWSDLREVLAGEYVARLEAIDTDASVPLWKLYNLKRPVILAALARSLLAARGNEVLDRVVDRITNTPKLYPIEGVLIPALVSLAPELKEGSKPFPPALKRWIAVCREHLESLTAQAPREPKDWRREGKVSCACADCRELVKFLENPDEQSHRFSIRENRRRHLEEKIRQHKLDLDCTTDRTRSPHTLVCTKNTASYQAAMKKYNQEKERLATLLALLPVPH